MAVAPAAVPAAAPAASVAAAAALGSALAAPFLAPHLLQRALEPKAICAAALAADACILSACACFSFSMRSRVFSSAAFLLALACK